MMNIYIYICTQYNIQAHTSYIIENIYLHRTYVVYDLSLTTLGNKPGLALSKPHGNCCAWPEPKSSNRLFQFASCFRLELEFLWKSVCYFGRRKSLLNSRFIGLPAEDLLRDANWWLRIPEDVHSAMHRQTPAKMVPDAKKLCGAYCNIWWTDIIKSLEDILAI